MGYDTPKTEEGLFVYQVVHPQDIGVRTRPEYARDGNCQGAVVRCGEVFSCDMRLQSAEGVFVRLHHPTAWLFETLPDNGQPVLQPLPLTVEDAVYEVVEVPAGLSQVGLQSRPDPSPAFSLSGCQVSQGATLRASARVTCPDNQTFIFVKDGVVGWLQTHLNGDPILKLLKSSSSSNKIDYMENPTNPSFNSANESLSTAMAKLKVTLSQSSLDKSRYDNQPQQSPHLTNAKTSGMQSFQRSISDESMPANAMTQPSGQNGFAEDTHTHMTNSLAQISSELLYSSGGMVPAMEPAPSMMMTPLPHQNQVVTPHQSWGSSGGSSTFLDVEQVRRLAEFYGLREINYHTSGGMSFESHSKRNVRLDIQLNTNTVMTYIQNPFEMTRAQKMYSVRNLEDLGAIMAGCQNWAKRTSFDFLGTESMENSLHSYLEEFERDVVSQQEANSKTSSSLPPTSANNHHHHHYHHQATGAAAPSLPLLSSGSTPMLLHTSETAAQPYFQSSQVSRSRSVKAEMLQMAQGGASTPDMQQMLPTSQGSALPADSHLEDTMGGVRIADEDMVRDYMRKDRGGIGDGFDMRVPDNLSENLKGYSSSQEMEEMERVNHDSVWVQMTPDLVLDYPRQFRQSRQSESTGGSTMRSSREYENVYKMKNEGVVGAVIDLPYSVNKRSLQELDKATLKQRIQERSKYHHKPITGKECYMSSFKDYATAKNFDSDLDLCTRQCVALGKGYMIVNVDHTVAFTDIPEGFAAVLEERRSLRIKPPPEYAVLGPGHFFFVRFLDGFASWQAPRSFSDAVIDDTDDIAKVAFGENNGWIVLYQNGETKWDDIPRSLAKIVCQRPKDLPKIVDITLGPEKQWFVMYEDQKWEANLFHEDLNLTVDYLVSGLGLVERIVFGQDVKQWFVLGVEA